MTIFGTFHNIEAQTTEQGTFRRRFLNDSQFFKSAVESSQYFNPFFNLGGQTTIFVKSSNFFIPLQILHRLHQTHLHQIHPHHLHMIHIH